MRQAPFAADRVVALTHLLGAPDHAHTVLLADLALDHGRTCENARAGLAERHGQGAVGELGGEARMNSTVFEVLVERTAQHRLLLGVQETFAVERPRKAALEACGLLL